MADISRAELKYKVERQREELRTLNEVGKLLSSTDDPQQMIDLVATYLHQAFPMAVCGIYVSAQKRLYIKLFVPLTKMEQSTAIRYVRESASQLLGKPILEADSALIKDSVFDSAQSFVQSSIALRSSVAIPITEKGKPTGVLCLFSGQAEAFTKDDRHAIEIVAEQFGASLRNGLLLEELRIADELKNQMLSIVSHELSTPLTAIKEGVNLVLEGALGETTDDQKDFLQTVVDNTDRLERMVDKVKTATKIMSEQLTLSFQSVDLRSIVAKIENSYRPVAASRKVNFKVVEHQKPLFWYVDPQHLAIGISQVVENAIQATPEDGLVTLRLSATAQEAEIQILDTGAGVPKEELSTLFDRFKSLGEIHERKMGGLGLGLFIARSLIEGHGGTITPESTLGEGTLMTIRLPKRTQSASA